MKCPVCWTDVALTASGNWPRHRTKKPDDTSFCPMSGEPYTPQTDHTPEAASA